MDDVTTLITEFVERYAALYAYNLVMAIIILVVGLWVVKRIAGFTENAFKRKLDITVASFLARILHVALIVFVLIAALDRLGVQTTSLIAIFGAAGLAVGLALKDSLGNFAAGVMLLMFRPFRVGDYVEAGGTAGTIQEIRIFATLMNTPDNKVITIPNGAIMSSNITNYSTMPTRRVDLVFRVSYQADLRQVKEVIQAVLGNDERILKEPAPTVAVSQLSVSSVDLIVRPWVNTADYWGVYWDITEAMKIRFDEEDISIPFPQMDVHFDKPEK